MKCWKFRQFGAEVYFTTDWRQIKNETVRWKFERDAKTAGGVCHEDKEGGIYIWIEPDKESDFINLVDYVAHEVFHAVGYLYKHIGDNTRIRHVEEAPAYHQGFLTGEILKELGYE